MLFPKILRNQTIDSCPVQTGLMFWFIRKKFVGSYFFFSSTSRL